MAEKNRSRLSSLTSTPSRYYRVGLIARIVDVRALREQIQLWAGPPPPTMWETLAQLVVGEWESDRMRATLATLAMSSDDDPFDYSELPKVTL